MPKKQNAELITQTAEVLLKAIMETAESYTTPDHLKDLAEAFALVAQHDTDVPREGGRVINS